MNESELKDLAQKGETLTVEFKSDRKIFSDKDIFDCIVAFSNTSGGALLIGVEDNGEITGINATRSRAGQFDTSAMSAKNQIQYRPSY